MATTLDSMAVEPLGVISVRDPSASGAAQEFLTREQGPWGREAKWSLDELRGACEGP